jgi:siderophore synthetase component
MNKLNENVFLDDIDSEIELRYGLCRRQIQETLPSAKWNSLKRLIQAILREEMINFDTEGFEHRQNAFIPLWSQKKLMQLKGVRRVSLSRYPELQSINILDESQQSSLTDPYEFIELITQSNKFNFDDKGIKQLQIEVADSTKNDSLTIAYRKNWNKEILESAHKQKIDNLCEWAIKNHKDYSLFFEQWGSVGHPYHPCAKTKLGFSTKEVLSYSPEFQGGAEISLLAVHKDIMHIASSQENLQSNNWIENQYPKWFKKWKNKLESKGFSSDEYLALPIHPWQIDNSLKINFSDFLKSRQVIILEDCIMSSKATMSFRSVCPQENELCPHIKLPVAVQATSAVRTVSPASIQTGPQVSKILTQIQNTDFHIKENFIVIPEYFGMHFNAIDDDRQKHLSVLFRENPSRLCKKGEIPIVVASLFVDSPFNDKPLLCELIQSSGAKNEQDILDYFSDYTNIVINSFLRLYLKFGISLEAHQQNTLMVFKNGKPQKVMSRDFGGIRIHKPTLSQSGFDIKSYPGAVTIRDDKDEIRNKLLYTTYQSHLGEIILLLSKEYDLNENILWKIVRNISKECFKSIKDDIDKKIYEEEYTMIFHKTGILKHLLE